MDIFIQRRLFMSVLMQEWTEKITAWRDSGLSIAAWCRQAGESYYRFIYWRKRLQPKHAEGAGTGKFVEIRVAHSPLCLECNGIYLHVERGFDRDLLSDILAVLKTV
jgi:hypothetical protein